MSSRLCPFCMRMAEGDTCPHCGKNTDYSGQPMHLPAGYVVSGAHPYVLGAALGQGGFGITYIALDMVTNQRVAIKEYYPTYCSARTDNSNVTAYSNQEEVYLKGKERFLEEARTLKSLSDLNNIVNVLDFFEANNSAYLVMEYLDGSSLKEYASKNGKFPAQKFLAQIRPLMEDIQRMHQRGVIHRDIAPDNIILLPDGQMKLIDFGSARSYLGDKSMTVVIKKGFAPVEQYMSKGSSASTDVYALAATIYYCITGKVPPDSAERQYDNTPLDSPSVLGAELSSTQEKALFMALEIQQKTRTRSVQEFLDQIHAEELAKTAPKPKPVVLKPDPIKPKPSFRKKLMAAAAAVLVLVGGLFLFSGKNFGSSESELSQYTLACDYMSQGKYNDACQLFKELGRYKNSKLLLEEATFLWAEQLSQEKQFEEALVKLEEIPNFGKTPELINEVRYKMGISYLTQKKYFDAYTELSNLPAQYEDANNYLHQIKKEWGRHIIENALSGEALRYSKLVSLTEEESDYIYGYLINKDYYSPLGADANSEADFLTRSYLLDALSGKHPQKEALKKLFSDFKTYNSDNFIKENKDLFSELWDIPVAKNIITHDWNLTVWLLGDWSTKDGRYINFYYKDSDTQTIWCDFNLPWTKEPIGTTGYNIINQEFIWINEEDDELAKVYRFNLLTPDSMEVYCYKDNQTYTVTRS